MNLENVEKVAELKERREKLSEVFKAAQGRCSVICEFVTLEDGAQPALKPSSVLSPEPLLAAVANAAADAIVAIDTDLLQLGVIPPRFTPPYFEGPAGEHPDVSTSERAAKYWRDVAMMFGTAWNRELGPRRRCAHFIDELVVGTQALRAKAARLDAIEVAITAAAARDTFLEADLFQVVGNTLGHIICQTRRDLAEAKARQA